MTDSRINPEGPVQMWLDDLRPVPDGWTWVKTYSEAIELLATGRVVKASLDHDLADFALVTVSRDGYPLEGGDAAREMTGYDVVLWMLHHDTWPAELAVHSANPVGRANMVAVITAGHPAGAACLFRW